MSIYQGLGDYERNVDVWHKIGCYGSRGEMILFYLHGYPYSFFFGGFVRVEGLLNSNICCRFLDHWSGLSSIEN